MNHGDQIREELIARMRERILLLDGAMGTMIQAHGLAEADYRGKEFAIIARDLRLQQRRAQSLAAAHHRGYPSRQYLEAGADIIETNTFNSNAISMADYGLETRVDELNVAGARIARAAATR